MEIEILKQTFSVCKVADCSHVRLDGGLCFIGKTDTENSLVCPIEDVPENTVCKSDNWRGLRICGTLDFSLVGILASAATMLAENNISIFAVSTYDTDYIFTKSDVFERAVGVLCAGGFSLARGKGRGEK